MGVAILIFGVMPKIYDLLLANNLKVFQDLNMHFSFIATIKHVLQML